MTGAPGRVIAGRYRLDAPLGHGGMGEVWRAWDQRLERDTAVKLIRAERAALFGDREMLTKRFVRECRALARVDHPGVVAIHDAGRDPDQTGGELFLVMQYIEGVRLADWLVETEPVPWAQAVALGTQIASVLTTLHALPVVHRDLKPANVMLRPDGTAVLLDLGIAGLLDPDASRLTRTGEMLGSPAYTAPELAVSGTSGPAGDLYALGCVLHEALCGEPVFSAPTLYALYEKHAKETPRPVRAVRPEVPEPFEALILALLAKDPQTRPRAVEVYRALAAMLPAGDGEPERAHDPWRPFRRPMAPAPRLLAGVVAGAVGATGAAARSRGGVAATAATAPTTAGPTLSAPAPPAPAAPSLDFDLDAALARAESLVGASRYAEAANVLAAVMGAAQQVYGPNSTILRNLQAQHANIVRLSSGGAAPIGR
ncbi:MAG: serine/threonine protein kinase [Catenulispora sp.]|nr:serine/threonine protein kinase [Catenulispora sp.]